MTDERTLLREAAALFDAYDEAAQAAYRGDRRAYLDAWARATQWQIRASIVLGRKEEEPRLTEQTILDVHLASKQGKGYGDKEPDRRTRDAEA